MQCASRPSFLAPRCPPQDIAGHCLAMLFAGTLAMANAATTVACLCTQSTEAREALLAEMATWPEEEQRFRGPLDFGRINDSALFDSAIFEAMRWAPPVPGMFRRIDKDVNLDGREIPAGTNVIVSLLLQASDPHTYKEPGTYCPMRFVPGFSMGEPKPNTFGSGPHLCLGAEVAKAELKARLRASFRLSQSPPPTCALSQPRCRHRAYSLTAVGSDLTLLRWCVSPGCRCCWPSFFATTRSHSPRERQTSRGSPLCSTG